MMTSAAWIQVDPERIAGALHEAAEKVNAGESEIVLSFSSVARIDSSAAGALEDLARLADERSVQVVLRGVNVAIYRVLTQLRLAQRFRFLT
jgi:anti-anti-sigma regulatory factor